MAATLLGLIFLATQAIALTHEMEHVLHQHDPLCVLHVAVDHLAMVVAPEPEPAVTPPPLIFAASSGFLAPLARPAHSGAARAPPLLS